MSDYLKRSTTGLEEANAIDESTGAADAGNGRRAHGFVRASFSAEATATAYGAGYINDQLTGLTPAATYYLSTTAGDVATTGPASAASHIHQELGVALSATALLFVPAQPIALVGA